jgi:hypothetical protein
MASGTVFVGKDGLMVRRAFFYNRPMSLKQRPLLKFSAGGNIKTQSMMETFL